MIDGILNFYHILFYFLWNIYIYIYIMVKKQKQPLDSPGSTQYK